jgi:hypothetical protein
MHYHILHKKHTHINTNLSRATHNIHILPITYHVLYIKHTHITNNLPCTTHKTYTY